MPKQVTSLKINSSPEDELKALEAEQKEKRNSHVVGIVIACIVTVLVGMFLAGKIPLPFLTP